MKRTFFTLLALAAVFTAQGQQQQRAAQGQDFTQAASEAERRKEAAQEEFARLQEEIAPRRAELGSQLALLEEELRSLQQEHANSARISQTLDVEVNQLQQRIRSLEDTNSYIRQTLLNEYIRRFEMNITPAERDRYQQSIRAALEAADAPDGVEIGDRQIFERQIATIRDALARLGDVTGGTIIAGSAVTQEQVHEGQFAILGPLTYFTSPAGSGIVNGIRENQLLPEVYALPAFAPAIEAVIAGERAMVPVDASGNSRTGTLQSLQGIEADMSLVEEFYAGGIVMYAIIGLFIIAILISIFKFLELASIQKAKESDLEAVLDHLRRGDKEAAMNHARSIRGPAGLMLVAAVEHADDDKEVIEEVLYERIVKTQPKLERFLAFIAVTAATAPLLGLLGTVTGMIRTFKLITIIGTGDAAGLSSGISEALITTKWGLIVAIPTLIAHALLNRKAKSVIGSLEQTGVGFINGIVEIRESRETAA